MVENARREGKFFKKLFTIDFFYVIMLKEEFRDKFRISKIKKKINIFHKEIHYDEQQESTSICC